MDYKTYLDAYHALYPLSASALIITPEGQWMYHHGEANALTHEPLTHTSYFAYASISKFITAVTLFHLMDQGKCHLHQPLSDFIKGYPHLSAITLHHLLSHSSGLRSYTVNNSAENRSKLSTQQTARDLQHFLLSSPLLFEPGQKYLYSNTGYMVLGWLVEHLTGESFESYVQREVLLPLGLAQVGYGWEKASSKTVGYELNGNAIIPSPTIDLTRISATGGLVGPITEFTHLHRLLETKSYLSPQSMNLLTKEVDKGFGYGSFFSSIDGHPRLRHNGSVLGFLGQWDYYPNDHISIIVLSNYGFQNIHGLTENLARIAFNEEVPLPSKLPSIDFDINQFKDLEGVYRDPLQLDDFYIKVYNQNSRPFMQFKGRDPFPLEPIGPMKFAHTIIDEIYEFEETPTGIRIGGLEKKTT